MLVSILIPAFNAGPWIADAIRSARDQTWKPIEIIVIDDGSEDQTLSIAKSFESRYIKVISHANQGASFTRNRLLHESQGEYIQWLDADDLLHHDKIRLQLIGDKGDGRILSSSWGRFYYRSKQARIWQNALCQSLDPVEWLQTKMYTNAWMAIESWLVPRCLAEAAGSWDTSLSADDDGEYFARLICASNGTIFTASAESYCRLANPNSLSKAVRNPRWLVSQFSSLEKQIGYLLKIDNSQKSREACLILLQRWFGYFYPSQPILVEKARNLAATLGGVLSLPRCRPKYRWLEPVVGYKVASSMQSLFPRLRASFDRNCDKILYKMGC